MISVSCTVSLNAVPTEDVFCKYSLVDGTACSFLNGNADLTMVDYLATNGFVTFLAGTQTATITVQINDNVASAKNKTFYIVLYDAHNCDIDTTPQKCTIVYNGNDVAADEDETTFASLDSIPNTVGTLPPFWSYLSFSSPENCRWSDTSNILNRTSDWVTERYFEYHATITGIHYGRLCNSYETLQDMPFGDPQPARCAMQRKAVAWANKYGIKILNSNHNDSQWCLDGAVSYMGDGIFTQAAFEHTVSTQLKVFQDVPGFVCYQLNSEPDTTSMDGLTATWGQYSQAAINAIREFNKQVYLFVDAAGPAVPTDFAKNNVVMEDIVDSADRMYIISDIYMDTYGGGGLPYMKDIMVEQDGYLYNTPINGKTGPTRIGWVTPWIAQYNKVFAIGETGGGAYDAYGELTAPLWKQVVKGMGDACYYGNIPMGVWCSGPDFNTYYTDFSGLIENRYGNTLDPQGSTLRYGIPAFTNPKPNTVAQFKKYFGPDVSLSWSFAPTVSLNSAGQAVVSTVFAFNSTYAITLTLGTVSNTGSYDSPSLVYEPNVLNQTKVANFTPQTGTFCELLTLSNDAEVRILPDATVQTYFDTDIFETLGLTPDVVLWPAKIVAAYSGAAFNLTKSDGTGSTDYSYTVGGTTKGIGATVDNDAVTTALGSSPLVKTWYDQSGNANNLGPFLGEENSWSNSSGSKPLSTYSDYPRYMTARDVAYNIPHFGGDFGDYTKEGERANRMDLKYRIDGEMKVTLVFAFGANIAIGVGDYILAYTYSQKNLWFGPNSVSQLVGYVDQNTNVASNLNNLNIYTFEYDGGTLVSTEDGTASTDANSNITFVGATSGTTLVANYSTGKVVITPSGGTSTEVTAQHYNIDYAPLNSGVYFVWDDGTNTNVLTVPYSGTGGSFAQYAKDGTYQIYRDGVLQHTSTAQGPLIDQYNGIMNVCWDRFYASTTVCDLVGLMALRQKLTDTQRSTLYNSLYASLNPPSK